MADTTELRGRVGQATALPGETHTVRITERLALLMAMSQAPFQAAVERGNVFVAANQSGVTSQAGLSATTPVLTLVNPAGSGKNAVIWYVGANFLVAFAAAAAVFVAVNSNPVAAPITAGSLAVARNLKAGGATPQLHARLATTLPAAPEAFGILGAGLTGAITTLPGTTPYERWYNGGLILTPGTALSLQTSTASGTNAMLCEYIWEEVDIQD